MPSEEIFRQITTSAANQLDALNRLKGEQDSVDQILNSIPPGDPIFGQIQSARAFLNNSIRQLTKSAKRMAEQIDEDPPTPEEAP